jgi:hypothetical protein
LDSIAAKIRWSLTCCFTARKSCCRDGVELCQAEHHVQDIVSVGSLLLYNNDVERSSSDASACPENRGQNRVFDNMDKGKYFLSQQKFQAAVNVAFFEGLSVD